MNKKINLRGGANSLPSPSTPPSSPKPTSARNSPRSTSSGLAQMHKDGTLKDFVNDILGQIGLYFGIFFLIITMPAMPVIFYLSILYNVILLTWEKFKALDHYKQ